MARKQAKLEIKTLAEMKLLLEKEGFKEMEIIGKLLNRNYLTQGLPQDPLSAFTLRSVLSCIFDHICSRGYIPACTRTSPHGQTYHHMLPHSCGPHSSPCSAHLSGDHLLRKEESCQGHVPRHEGPGRGQREIAWVWPAPHCQWTRAGTWETQDWRRH